jgi:23S rRNA (guanosine2251-2'-O)-methyltransferase
MNIVVVLNNIRSCHNVGSILRTCNGFGVREVCYVGITPYPNIANDLRLPHLIKKIDDSIQKTALGSQHSLNHYYFSTLNSLVSHQDFSKNSFWAIENTNDHIPITKIVKFPNNVALVFGNEIDGLEDEDIKLCRKTVSLPMFGSKESFNVSVAAAIVLSFLVYKQN